MDVLFVGSDNSFNIEGLTAFLTRHREWLKTKAVVIAGSVCRIQSVRESAEMAGAVLLGFVDDLDELYASSKIVVSPVDGTGLKIKVIEALKHGKPVFGSDHSLDALPPGYHQCAFRIDEAHMSQMIESDELRRQVASDTALYLERVGQESDGQRLWEIILGNEGQPG